MTVIRRKRLVCVKSEQVMMVMMMMMMMIMIMMMMITMTMLQVVVGDVLKLGCDQEVPCDAIVLSSDHSGGQVRQGAKSYEDDSLT